MSDLYDRFCQVETNLNRYTKILDVLLQYEDDMVDLPIYKQFADVQDYIATRQKELEAEYDLLEETMKHE
jgi:hypothetical protein